MCTTSFASRSAIKTRDGWKMEGRLSRRETSQPVVYNSDDPAHRWSRRADDCQTWELESQRNNVSGRKMPRGGADSIGCRAPSIALLPSSSDTLMDSNFVPLGKQNCKWAWAPALRHINKAPYSKSCRADCNCPRPPSPAVAIRATQVPLTPRPPSSAVNQAPQLTC